MEVEEYTIVVTPNGEVLADLIEAIRVVGAHSSEGTERIAGQLRFSLSDGGAVAGREWSNALAGRALPKTSPIFPRIKAEDE